MNHCRVLAGLVVALASGGLACSSDDSTTSSSSSGSSGTSSSGSTSTSSGTSVSEKFSCKVNGTCFKCPSSEAVRICATDAAKSGCTREATTFCD